MADVGSFEMVAEQPTGDQELCQQLLQAVGTGDSLVFRSLFKAQPDLVKYTDSNGNTLLHIACEKKQFKVVHDLVQAGVNVQERNSSGDTALHIAAGSTTKRKVLILLSTRDTLSSRGREGRTPLHCACETGMLEAANELVELKCDVSATENEGRTGLHVASAGGYLKIVQLLLATSKDLVQQKDACGYTALHYACEGGHDEIVKLLCTSNADVAVRNSNNETPLDMAALKGHTKVVDCILSKGRCSKDITGVKGRSALHHACANGHVRLAEVLVNKQCNVCAEDDNRMTPLHLASANGNVHLVELLGGTNKSNCKVNSVDSLGCAPVHLACQNGHVDALKALIRYGAELNIQNKDGQLPLHLAAFNGHKDIIHTLVSEYQCDIRPQDSKGMTCFHLACAGGHDITVKTLIENHSFDPKEKDGNGMSPIEIAALNGKDNIVTLLESTYECSLKESPSSILAAMLRYSCLHGSTSILKLALEHGADINQRMTPRGGSALHFACEHGHPLVIRHLTSCLKISDVNKGDDSSYTPLHIATIHGHQEAVRELSRCAGLLIDVSDKAGITPLQHACIKGHKRIAKLLIDLGANVQVCYLKGFPALHSAAYGGQEDVMNMLINEYNCDPMALDKRGRLPLHTACIAGHVKLVRALVEKYKYDINSKDHKGVTPLHLASTNGREELVVELVQNFKSELECVDLNGMSAAHYAAHYGFVAVLRALKHFGANMDARIAGGNGLLHLAALNGHSNVIEFLVNECKMDIMTPGYCHRCVLHCVCEKGEQRQLHLLNELLVTYKLDINVVDENGWTPLHVASAFGNEEVVRLLLNTPTCDPYIKAQNGCLAVEQACLDGHIGSVKAFLEYNNKTENSRIEFSNLLHFTCQGGHTKLLRFLVEEWNFDTNTRDRKGRTPLHIAILCEKEDVVKQLLKLNCQIDCVDSTGVTPLVHAVKKNKRSLVEILIQFGAATEFKVNEGCTPLTYAVQHNYQDIFELLIGKCKTAEIFNSMKSLESQKKELENQLQIAKIQLREYEEKRKEQETMDRRRSFDDINSIKQEVIALRSQLKELERDIAGEGKNTGFSLQSLSSASDLAPVVNELANELPYEWKKVCSDLGTSYERLQDIERESCKHSYTMAFIDLNESNKLTLDAVIDVLKRLGHDDVATSLQSYSQWSADNGVEQSLQVPVSLQHSFVPLSSLASCGRNSAFLCEDTNGTAVTKDCGPIIEENVMFSTSSSRANGDTVL